MSEDFLSLDYDGDEPPEAETAREWIEWHLSQLPFVEWDRFIDVPDDHLGHYLAVYGWIPREKDAYKDFVVMRFWIDGSYEYISSSPMADKRIQREHPYFSKGDGSECQRVEDELDVPNAVELGAKT